MPDRKRTFSRRDFIKAAGAAGLGSALIPLASAGPALASPAAKPPEELAVPTRPFGKTGARVAILSLGGVLKATDLLLFRQAFKLGVTYWDTADSYGWGNNEKAIGNYFAKFPDDRKEVFLVTKGGTSDVRELSEKLDTSLARMNTAYVDMYFIHYVSHVKEELTAEVKAWAEKEKAKGRMRFFGFSTHKNMENCLLEASKLGWIDGIMTTYNYRLMGKDDMKRGVDACVKAGIGLTAMKTQAAFSANFYASIGSETDEAVRMTESFMRKGYTAEQARLKVVWENPQIASICSAMPNMAILKANVEAATKTPDLSGGDRERLERYARQTAPGYCAGCADICESAVDEEIPIGDLLRYCMYRHSYGCREMALELRGALPGDLKAGILRADFSAAERRCPQKMPIGRILKEACEDLA
jgi:hypothetical protein